MKPILFDKSETTFTSNGLGRLSDAVSCTVTEERNGIYELEMVYPVTGNHYSDITYDRIILAKPADGKKPQPFQIYEIARPMDGKVTVKGEHISYRMSYIPVMPCSASNVGDALTALKANAAENCPFTFWTDKYTEASFSVDVPASMRSLLGGTSGSILDAYGGEWEFDMFTARLWKARGQEDSASIRYGKNLTDLKQEESIASVYTGIVPYWKGTTATAEDGSGGEEKVVTLPEKAVYAETKGRYPFSRTVPVDFSSRFESEPTAAQLRSAAASYIKANNIGYPKVTLTVSFVPIWQADEYRNLTAIEHVNLCDKVHVAFPEFGISTSAKVVKTVYNVLLERYDSIELGDAKSTLSDSIQMYAEQAAEAAASESKSYTDQTTGVNIEDRLSNYYTKTETDKKVNSAESSAANTSEKYTDQKLADYYTKTVADKKLEGYYTKEETDKKIKDLSDTVSGKADKDGIIAAINASSEEELISAEKVDLSDGVSLSGTFASKTEEKEMKLDSGILAGDNGKIDFSDTDDAGNKRVAMTSEGDMILSAAKLYVPGGYFDVNGFHRNADSSDDSSSSSGGDSSSTSGDSDAGNSDDSSSDTGGTEGEETSA